VEQQLQEKDMLEAEAYIRVAHKMAVAEVVEQVQLEYLALIQLQISVVIMVELV
tara:strand:- start:150 stop:311 length:162 start_codon:yes stop_codon:yes gene_type:complete